MRGTKYSITAAAILLCAVMVLVAAAPMTIAAAGDTHTIVKGEKGPRASAVTWVFETGPDAGVWTGKIDNNGLRSLVIEVADNTTGVPSEIFKQRIRFAAYDAYPVGTVITEPVLMNPNSKYEITGVPNGPRGTSCIVTDQWAIAMAPTASFTYSVSGATVSVDASGSTDDGTIVSYDWEWGDGTTGSGVTASHTYAATDTYVITLTVTDDLGLTGSTSQSVYVEVPVNQNPIASFTVSVTELTVSVDASASYDPDGSIVSYAWNWGDGTTGTGVTATHTYAAGGTYTITLTVTDNMGATGSASQSVTVSPPAPATTMTYTISNMFELYLKPTDYSKLGRWGSTMGVNSWFDLRKPNYGEWILRNTYPFTMAYNPYSTQTTPDVSVGNVITTWYRMYVDAKGLTTAGTGPGMDPILVPVMGNIASSGGTVQLNWYSTYMTTQEMADARNGVHYANTYYGVRARVTPPSSQDDGYWHEFQGTMSFSRDACKKFLGMAATGDLEDEFNANQAIISGMWFDDWMAEGSGGGAYDIYTAYDYPNDIRVLNIIVDPLMANTDPDTLYLRIWAISWGIDVLLVRYVEALGVQKYWQPWADDWYLNATITTDKVDLQMRAVMGYHMMAWQDMAGSNTPAWSLEAVHIDWCGNIATHNSYISPFNAYDPDQTDVMKTSYSPSSVNFGKKVSYWLAPMEMDLVAGEKWVFKLQTYGQVIGYTPRSSTTDKLDDAKLAEYATYSKMGTLTLGPGWPADLSNYYDPVTKTLTLIGPMDMPRMSNPTAPTLLETGSPTIILSVK